MHVLGPPRRLHTQVVDALVRAIVGGDFAPGSALPAEAELSARFGVSRAVVREAMRVMVAKGLVEVRHGSGSWVTPPERWDPLDALVLAALRERGPNAAILRDLLEARRIIECEVAALAAQRATAGDLAELERALDVMRASIDDPPRFVTGDSALHLALLRAGGNRVLERMTQPMHDLLSYAQALTDAIPGVLRRALADHEAIVAAVRARDAAAAAAAMRRHLAETERDIIALTEGNT